MGNTPSITNTFTANTKAKSSQVNTNFTNALNFVNDGTYDLFSNSFAARRTSNGNVTLGHNRVYITGYHQIGGDGTNTTYNIATSTARMICFSDLQVVSGSSLIVTPGAEVRVI